MFLGLILKPFFLLAQLIAFGLGYISDDPIMILIVVVGIASVVLVWKKVR